MQTTVIAHNKIIKWQLGETDTIKHVILKIRSYEFGGINSGQPDKQ
jgi:hypothetical protein